MFNAYVAKSNAYISLSQFSKKIDLKRYPRSMSYRSFRSTKIEEKTCSLGLVIPLSFSFPSLLEYIIYQSNKRVFAEAKRRS